MKPGRSTTKLVKETEYIKLEADGSDAWRCSSDVSTILQKGGCGVIPTETGYAFVTPLNSKAGLKRILRMKGEERCKKPLSLLCADLATIDKYCYGIDRKVFQTLKKFLPGPYTFVLPASTAVPKMVTVDDRLGGKTTSWVRRSLGVRISTDPVLRYVQDELLDKMPLLVSSLPTTEDGLQLVCSALHLDPDTSWCNAVDFIVDAGERHVDGSTVYDLTQDEPELVREGLGALLDL